MHCIFPPGLTAAKDHICHQESRQAERGARVRYHLRSYGATICVGFQSEALPRLCASPEQ